ncbi:hypothetical protein JCM33374_g2901 [Metschnikowia sp. JCM 33374]|nr:hypothetical protein JCM33374_g2901 [Metschnikowia sp. JCM 33374]
MSRLRRLDRAILSEGADSTPIDSDDQESLIAHLAEQNNASRRFFLRVLIASILVEIPISVLGMRLSVGGARPVALLLVCHVLTLINGLYDFQHPSEARGELFGGAFGASIDVETTRRNTDVVGKLVSAGKWLLSFYGILVLNTVVLLQLLRQVYLLHGFEAIDTLLILPVINIIAMALVRKWYGDISREIRALHGLKYKFKTA